MGRGRNKNFLIKGRANLGISIVMVGGSDRDIFRLVGEGGRVAASFAPFSYFTVPKGR